MSNTNDRSPHNYWGIENNDKSFNAGALFSAGLLIPLTSGKNGFHVSFFGDGFLALGSLPPYPALITRAAAPGFDGGLRFSGDIFGDLGLGIDFKYRGFLFAGGRLLHAVSFCMVYAFTW